MNILSKVRTVARAGAIALIMTGCGGAEITDSSSQDLMDSSESLSLASYAKFPEKSVLLIRIERPYCRSSGKVEGINVHQTHICTGTVISDRHVLTAAHCFVSDCPTRGGMEPVRVSGIKIPKSPTTVMTDFDWDDRDKVIAAKNVAVSDGFNGQTARIRMLANARLGQTLTPLFRELVYFTRTSDDIAVIDFGSGILSSNGYQSAAIATSEDFNYKSDQIIPVGYNDVSTPGTLKRLSQKPRDVFYIDNTIVVGRQNKKLVFSSRVNEPVNDGKFIRRLIPSPRSPEYAAGCWGDSGGPAFYNGKVVGVASTSARLPIANDFGCVDVNYNDDKQSGNVTYVSISPGEIRKLQNTSNMINSRGTVEISSFDKYLDLWDRKTEPDDLDRKLTPEQRTLHFIASTSGAFTVSGFQPEGSSVWSQLVDPVTNISSQTPGGTIRQATAAGSGTRTATWNFPTLTPGYYRVEILYPRRFDNATCVLVQTKSTKDTNFLSRPAKLNQQLGTGVTSQSTTFSNTKTNVTPFTGSNSGSYIWVDPAANSKSGSLSVRLSDAGCSSGRMVADTVVLTFISGNK